MTPALFEPPTDPRPDDTPWPAMNWPPPSDVALIGDTVLVRPAVPALDGAGLFAALDDEQLWTHVRGRPADGAEWSELLAARAGAGWLTWVVQARVPIGRCPAGSLVGTSSYLDVAVDDARIEIGATTYVREAWASAVNPETKLLLLGYAFDDLGVGRVQLKTDVRNHRSARAISRLGAHYEGALRRYQRRSDDTVRDTLLFSILAEEWPDVRAGLRARLAMTAS
ncbi:MAG TPA: GNAT family protein [Jatrophihabitantaceae bacterium]|nr:GNAT family protein [Jatrophihabitantaceae bacterium]